MILAGKGSVKLNFGSRNDPVLMILEEGSAGIAVSRTGPPPRPCARIESVRNPGTHPTGDINDRLPIIPHQTVGAPDCCGCLHVRVNGDQADIVCNECETVIRSVPIADVERVVLELAETDTFCTARCTHCGAVNTFPGMSTIEAFICSECGEGVYVAGPVQ